MLFFQVCDHMVQLTNIQANIFLLIM